MMFSICRFRTVTLLFVWSNLPIDTRRFYPSLMYMLSYIFPAIHIRENSNFWFLALDLFLVPFYASHKLSSFPPASAVINFLFCFLLARNSGRAQPKIFLLSQVIRLYSSRWPQYYCDRLCPIAFSSIMLSRSPPHLSSPYPLLLAWLLLLRELPFPSLCRWENEEKGEKDKWANEQGGLCPLAGGGATSRRGGTSARVSMAPDGDSNKQSIHKGHRHDQQCITGTNC